MDTSQIAFRFFKECEYPDQIADMARDHLPQWLTLHKVPNEQHEEAIALIQATAKELLKTRGYQ
jgi:dsDNA-binding SOS-regulon protein